MAMKALRLTYLCLETPREGQAVFTHVHEIIGGLRHLGWQVDLVTAEGGGSSTGRSLVSRLAGYAGAYGKMLARLWSSDAIYIRAHPAAYPIAALARMLGRPVFQELNGKPTDLVVTYPALRPFATVVSWAYRTQLAKADHVFTVTDGLRDWIVTGTPQRNVTIIPNGANTNVFTPGGARADLGHRYVIFAGGVTAWHGIGTMIAALAEPDWPADVRLLVVGDGVERGLLEKQSHNPKLKWLGRQPYRDLPALIRGAIAALCIIENPEDRSAMGVAPIKLYEAMACGVPVIVSKLPFQAELISSLGAGLVVPMANPAALASAVASLASSAEISELMGARGADYVRRSASWQARAADTSHVMSKVLGRSARVKR